MADEFSGDCLELIDSIEDAEKRGMHDAIASFAESKDWSAAQVAGFLIYEAASCLAQNLEEFEVDSAEDLALAFGQAFVVFYTGLVEMAHEGDQN